MSGPRNDTAAAQDVLLLRSSRVAIWFQSGCFAALGSLRLLLAAYAGRAPVFADWAWLAFFLAIAVLGLFSASKAQELRADRQGIAHRMQGRDRRIAWSAIESIGVARLGQGDSPIAKALARTGPGARAPMIGINLKPEHRTPGLDRGQTGYDLNWPNRFGVPVDAVIEALRTRMEQARASAE